MTDVTARKAALGAALTRLTRARLLDGQVVDLQLENGLVTTVEPSRQQAGTGVDELDLDGYLLIGAPADPHAHLDKAYSIDQISDPGISLVDAIAAWRRFSPTRSQASIAQAAERALRAMMANGTTAVRTHVDIDPNEPFVALEAILSIAERMRSLIEVQVVLLPGFDVSSATISEALGLGDCLLGGAPHLAPDPPEELSRLLRIADRHGVDLDLHMDERVDGEPTLSQYAAHPTTARRTASHCVRLGTLAPSQSRAIIAELAAAKVSVVTNPITNLYLQGWDESPVRGLPPLQSLIDGRVVLAAGGDNLRDPFNPLGRADALETAMLAVVAGHVGVADAVRLVTHGARAVLGLPAAGPQAGAVADLLAIRADNLNDLVATATADRTVIARGRLISQRTVHHQMIHNL